MEYEQFLESKRHTVSDSGVAVMPDVVHPKLFDWQKDIVLWSLKKGQGAIFADCGLGKTPMQLEWARLVALNQDKPVLILAPLAVAPQTVREAEKFGIEVQRSAGEITGRILVTNYEKLHHFHPSDFSAVVCDESSILKSFDGTRRQQITEFMRRVPFRLLCTATAAPNDYIELGTSSECLGNLGYTDMLGRFFINDQKVISPMRDRNREEPGWRFKGHAEEAFWRWVCSWARALRKPSDLGYDDDGFILPKLTEIETIVQARSKRPDLLFDMIAVGFHEEREVTRRTINERCEIAAEKAMNEDSAMIWCHLNAEGDLLENLIPRSIQVKGADTDEYKEAAAEWFAGKRCICNDPLFRAKLTTWRKDQMAIGANTIERIVNNANRSLSNTSASTPSNERNTCQSITENTPKSGPRGLTKKRTNAIASAAKSMPAIPQPDSRHSDVPKNTEYKNLQLGLNENSLNTELLLRHTVNSKSRGALSAGPIPLAVLEDSTLTTAIKTDISGGFYVPIATLDSESSAIVQSVLNGPQCICGHESGVRRLISKPVMFGYGLNFQHCAHVVYFVSHSYEQYYQAVRRCWRFGQTKPVTVDIIRTEAQERVMQNLKRKSDAADRMFADLVAYMNNAMRANGHREFNERMEVPKWL